MEIKITESLKAEVMAEAKKQLVAAIMSQFNTKQIAQEVKNSAIKVCSQNLSRNLSEKHGIDQVVERALQSAESRVQKQIQDKLTAGIVVSFAKNS